MVSSCRWQIFWWEWAGATWCTCFNSAWKFTAYPEQGKISPNKEENMGPSNTLHTASMKKDVPSPRYWWTIPKKGDWSTMTSFLIPPMDILIDVFVCTNILIYLTYIPTGIAGSYVKCLFNALRNCQSVFQSSCAMYISTNKVWEFQLFHILN